MLFFVSIKDAIVFSANNGVMVKDEILKYSSQEMKAMLKTAFDHVNDDLLVAAHCGGQGPLVDCKDMTIEEYLQIKAKYPSYQIYD